MMLLSLAACDMISGSKDKPAEKQAAQGSAIVPAGNAADTLLGTPMADRVAVVGLLNKRNGQTRDLVMKPGKALRVGDAVVRLRACEQTAPWENTPEVGAFVQLDVRSPGDGKWRRAFSGWVFKNRPERNVVEHPIYDVWVKECRMTWPETGPDTLKVGGKGDSSPAKSSGGTGNSTAEAPDSAEPAPATNAAN
ncbi:DUF2155 domain-containing protein [Sphingobium sp. SCG-1]|nr:DUF2155 domain-containing protein [Sphingobium sp. SCG-1]